MSYVSVTELAENLEEDGSGHREVLDAGPLTVEIGRYPAGRAAPKNPHNEEELYYILSGSGKFRVGDETHAVEEGDMVYVEPELEHDFFAIEEDITALIIFGSDSVPSSYAIREDPDG